MLNQIAAIHGTGVAAATNSYESIATATGNGSSGTLTFTSIPSTYKHLQLRWFVKNTGSGSTQYIFPIRFNSDSGSNYSAHYINANGSAVAASGNANMSGINFYFDFPANISNTYGVAIFDVLEYANTNIYKTTRSLNGYDANGSGQVAFNSGNWRSTSAINRIDISFNADAFATGSSIALYGIKG